MKTRIVFESKDFGGYGQMLVRNSSSPVSSDYQFMASVSYKVGYTFKNNGKGMLLIALTDGMCKEFVSVEELCTYLNNDEWGYRPMTREDIRHVCETQGNRFPNEGGYGK